MAVTASPRLGVTRWSAPADPFTRSQLDGDHGTLDTLAAIDLTGELAARPAAGIRGRYYFATNTGALYRDTGTAWTLVGGTNGTLGFASTTTSQTGISTETDLTNLILTVTVGAGRRLRLWTGMRLAASAADAGAHLRLKEGATQLGESLRTISIQGRAESLHAGAIISPSAGAHTYKVSLARFAGTGTVYTDVGVGYPAWLLAEDIGLA